MTSYHWNGEAFEKTERGPMEPLKPLAPVMSSKTPSRHSARPGSRRIQPKRSPFDKVDDINAIPMTPGLAALTPRTKALTIGQILLARALVCDVTGEQDNSPLSRAVLEVAATPKQASAGRKLPANNVTSAENSPRTVAGLKTPPLQAQQATNLPPSFDVNSGGNGAAESVSPVHTPKGSPASQSQSPLSSLDTGGSAKPPRPSPKSAKKLSKEEFQTLINARVSQSVAQRLVEKAAYDAIAAKEGKTPKPPPPPPPQDRFSTWYRTPGGQPVRFQQAGVNTPQTPRFGGDKARAAVDVEWSVYEAVHAPQAESLRAPGGPGVRTAQRHKKPAAGRAKAGRPEVGLWRVTPAHLKAKDRSKTGGGAGEKAPSRPLGCPLGGVSLKSVAYERFRHIYDAFEDVPERRLHSEVDWEAQRAVAHVEALDLSEGAPGQQGRAALEGFLHRANHLDEDRASQDKESDSSMEIAFGCFTEP